MGLDIMFIKTRNRNLKKASDAYSKDLADAIELYQAKTNRLLKRLEKVQYNTEEYMLAYAKFLVSMDRLNKVASKSVMNSIHKFGRVPNVEDIKTILKNYEPRMPKYSVYYRKLWFIYDYVISVDLIQDGEEYCWLEESALNRMIDHFAKVLESNSNYYGFIPTNDDTEEIKVFLKDMKHLRRYLKKDEKIYIDFSF